MKKYLQPKFLPLFVLAASVLGVILRLITIIPGADADGLYPSRPITWVLLWLVTLVTLAGIFLMSAPLKNPGRYADHFSKSIPDILSIHIFIVGSCRIFQWTVFDVIFKFSCDIKKASKRHILILCTLVFIKTHIRI